MDSQGNINRYRMDLTKIRYPLFEIWIVILFLILLSSCKPGANDQRPFSMTEPSASSDTDPTVPPFSIEILTPTSFNGTSPADSGDFETYLYTQPEGWFTVQAPKGWIVGQASDSVSFTLPQDGQKIVVSVVNTGYPLDDNTFTTLVENREAFNAREWQGYIEYNRQVAAMDDGIIVSKSFIDSDKLVKGESLYRLHGRTVAIVDYWVSQNGGLFNQELFSAVGSSLRLNEEAVAALPIYAFGQFDVKTSGDFSILVSPYWRFHRVGGDFSLVETYTSPDEHAVVQAIVYDDGQPITNSVAGELTLSLLKNSYTTEISIEDDEVLQDGREKLTWSSLDNNYQGISSFIARGSGLYILTVMWNNDPDLYYQTILNDVFQSFSLDNQSD